MAKQAQYLEAEDAQVFEVMRAQAEPEEEKTQFDHKLDELLESFKSVVAATVSVYRQRGTNLNEGLIFLDSFPADKYSREELMKLLRDEYGTGDYRVHIRVKGKLRANELVQIESPKKPEKTGDGGILESVLNRMEKMQEMIIQSQSNGNDRMAFLQEMVVMKQLFAGEQQPRNNGMQEMLATLAAFKDLGLIALPGQTDNDDNESADGGFLKFLSSMAPSIQTVIESAAKPRPAMPNPYAMPQGYPQPQSTPPSAPQPEPVMSNQVEMLVKSAMIMLNNAAQHNADPGFYADWILDQLPDEHLPDFLAMLNAPEWWTTLCNMGYVETIMNPLKPWYEKLRAEILAQFDESEPNNDTIENDSGR